MTPRNSPGHCAVPSLLGNRLTLPAPWGVRVIILLLQTRHVVSGSVSPEGLTIELGPDG